jgi:protein gp37
VSKIEWTDETWNPIAGCSKVSPGCTNCYAEKMAGRLEAMGQAKYAGLTVLQGSHRVWTGKIAFDEQALLAPLKRKKPTRYFVNSMSDLFHEHVTDEQIDRVFAVMALCPQHTFQVLTKRPERMLKYLTPTWSNYQPANVYDAADAISTDFIDREHTLWPLPNVWLGVSVESQKYADERIPLLLQTPAAVRFISAEPLLGPVDLKHIFDSTAPFGAGAFCNSLNGAYLELGIFDGPHLDLAIVGGESGPRARPMHPDWARSLRDQCEAAGVAFFFKQWGEWADVSRDPYAVTRLKVAESRIFTPTGEVLGAGNSKRGMVNPGWRDKGAAWMDRVGKKASGALLDGREWRQMPGEAR